MRLNMYACSKSLALLNFASNYCCFIHLIWSHCQNICSFNKMNAFLCVFDVGDCRFLTKYFVYLLTLRLPVGLLHI